VSLPDSQTEASQHRRSTREIEKAVGVWTRRHMPGWLSEFVVFVLKLGWASLFGGLMLAGIILSKALWPEAMPIHRYDALAFYAVGLQVLFLLFRLETLDEARVIVLFHLTGTAMEMFKVNAGSWTYPEPGVLKIMNVPLFTGFMYASVGSFMARAIRLFEMRFEPYPPFWTTVVLAVAIYVNFFAHHFLPDIRVALFAATLILFWRTRVSFHIGDNDYWMPMVVAGGLTSFFLWVAENIGTRTGTWLYPGQGIFDWVSWSKMGAWYLLIFVSFTTVTLVFRDALVTRPKGGRTRPARR
jgi:uncharacterized membrane protein YoaT (DUF817 family)